jgi:hypothetical protein
LPREAATLELAFETKSLRDICESEERATIELGEAVGEALRHRLADLVAATSTKDVLVGRPRRVDDYMVIDLGTTQRLVFKANHVENPKTESNDIDWNRVSRIKLLRIEGDHD